jgi:hypothetical protein
VRIFSSVKAFVDLTETHPAVTGSRGTASVEQETLGSDDGLLLAAALRLIHSFSFLLHVKQSLGVGEVREDTRGDGLADGNRILSPGVVEDTCRLSKSGHHGEVVRKLEDPTNDFGREGREEGSRHLDHRVVNRGSLEMMVSD